MKLWSSIALGVVALFVIVGVGAYAILPAPNPGIFDADLQKLAEDERTSWCAGQSWWGGADAKQCRAEDETHTTERNHAIVIPIFCRSIVNAGWGGAAFECKEIMEREQLWPTVNGKIAANWNNTYPYPGDVFARQGTDQTDSRTGLREGNTR